MQSTNAIDITKQPKANPSMTLRNKANNAEDPVVKLVVWAADIRLSYKNLAHLQNIT